MYNSMKLQFLSVAGNEQFARMTASAFASQLNPSIEELSDIRVSVSEAVKNAIVHGYDARPDKQVTLWMEIEDDTITIVVSDLGRGIPDIESATKPFFTSKPELEMSGMGFSVMQAFMDDVAIESTVGVGTAVTMRKRIRHAS